MIIQLVDRQRAALTVKDQPRYSPIRRKMLIIHVHEVQPGLKADAAWTVKDQQRTIRGTEEVQPRYSQA